MSKKKVVFTVVVITALTVGLADWLYLKKRDHAEKFGIGDGVAEDDILNA